MSAKFAKYGPLLLVFFLACVLRLSLVELMEYKLDEGVAMDLMKANLGDAWQLVGLQSSIGLMNPPMFIYLLSLPGLLSRNPVFVTAFIGLANVVGIVVLYFFAKKYFGGAAAVWSSLLLATNPWHVVYSRKLWAQDLLFPFMMLFLFTLFSYAERQTKTKACLIAFSLAVLTQLHMSAWFFFLTFALLVVLYGKRNKVSHLLLGSGVLLVVYIPYFIFHVQDGFVNLGTLIHRTSEEAAVLREHITWLAYTSTGVGFEYLLGGGYEALIASPFLLLTTHIMLAGGIACLLCILLWALLLAKKTIRRESWQTSERILGTLLFFVVCQCAFYGFLRIPAYPHYAIIFYPMPTLFLVATLTRFQNHIARVASTCFLMLLFVAQLTFICAFIHFLYFHHSLIQGDYGTPYMFQGE